MYIHKFLFIIQSLTNLNSPSQIFISLSTQIYQFLEFRYSITLSYKICAQHSFSTQLLCNVTIRNQSKFLLFSFKIERMLEDGWITKEKNRATTLRRSQSMWKKKNKTETKRNETGGKKGGKEKIQERNLTKAFIPLPTSPTLADSPAFRAGRVWNSPTV